MIRVLEVLASLRRAGAERVAVSLARGLPAERFQTGVVSLYEAFEDGFEATLAEGRIPVWHLGKRRGFDPRMGPRLAAVIRDFRPDIVHTHSYVMRYAWPACALARQGRIVHSVHNLAGREVDALGRTIHRLAFRAGAVPVAVSPRVADSFRAAYGFAPAFTIPNGVDTQALVRPDLRAAWRRARGFAPEDLLVAAVARLEPQKNPAGAIEAFARGLGGEPPRTCCGPVRAACWRPAGGGRGAWASSGACISSGCATMRSGGSALRRRYLPAGFRVGRVSGGGHRGHGGGPARGGPRRGRRARTGGARRDGPAGCARRYPRRWLRRWRALARDTARRQRMGCAAAARAARFDSARMVDAYAALFEKLRGRLR